MKNIKFKLFLVLIIFWGIVASILASVFWNKNQRLEKINSLLLKTLVEVGNLADNNLDAYKTFGECVTNQDTCSVQKTGIKLIELDEDSKAIGARILEIRKELQPLKKQ